MRRYIKWNNTESKVSKQKIHSRKHLNELFHVSLHNCFINAHHKMRLRSWDDEQIEEISQSAYFEESSTVPQWSQGQVSPSQGHLSRSLNHRQSKIQRGPQNLGRKSSSDLEDISQEQSYQQMKANTRLNKRNTSTLDAIKTLSQLIQKLWLCIFSQRVTEWPENGYRKNKTFKFCEFVNKVEASISCCWQKDKSMSKYRVRRTKIKQSACVFLNK